MIQRVVLYLSIIALGSVLSANAYTSVVDAPSWGASIPESLETARKDFQSTKSGHVLSGGVAACSDPDADRPCGVLAGWDKDPPLCGSGVCPDDLRGPSDVSLLLSPQRHHAHPFLNSSLSPIPRKQIGDCV